MNEPEAMSLVVLTFSAIFNERNRLYSQASSMKCRKERRKYLNRLKVEPVVRMCRIISSLARNECAEIPKTLTEDEILLKHALETNASLKLELQTFKSLVLDEYRYQCYSDRWWRRLQNSGKQHPDAYPVPNTADEVRSELNFRESDEYYEMGKTYFWYIHRYDETPSFAELTTHGNCDSCNKGLPVWRNCSSCAHDYFIDKCDQIYVKSLECNREQHQLDLKEVTKCHNCGGPEEIVVNRPSDDDTGPWFPNEVW